ncbi:MAG TPA: methyltransferase domain-containing protein [Hanamia sp.]|nr:methyltransferase domain-containing protein [Hanamia sp.]
MRKPYQGMLNVIRFNWPYYILSVIFILTALVIAFRLQQELRRVVIAVVLLVALLNIISLFVSWFIYDHSSLYRLTWLDQVEIEREANIININAGFDETSVLLKNKFPGANLTVLDFYDPAKHTEVSIKRAGKAYPPYPNTQKTGTDRLPCRNDSVDNVFVIFSAHEIRDDEERVTFFKEISRVLTAEGQVIVTEHLRDAANFFAYNIGFLHFHSKKTWLKTFDAAGLKVTAEIKITPFITTFILNKNGTAS